MLAWLMAAPSAALAFRVFRDGTTLLERNHAAMAGRKARAGFLFETCLRSSRIDASSSGAGRRWSLVPDALTHWQRGVSREPRIGARQPAQREPAPPRADDDLRVPARGAETGLLAGLNALRSIVHDHAMFTSEASTRSIRVSVVSEYAPDRSRPQDNQWFFLYTITIANEGAETVQLLSRHWIITDGAGKVEEVRGPGVVGQQPILGPGESFKYTSGCPLTTPFGKMEGTYQMVAPSTREQFDVRIAPFTLSEPYTVH